MLRWRTLAWCLVCSGWLLLGMQSAGFIASAAAQAALAPTAPAANNYDRFIEEALQAYDSGRFAEARTSFRRAHELTPTARTLRTIGMCSFNLGDYADAVWNLERARAETRKPLTEDQLRHVSDLLSRANQRIGRFRLRIDPPDASLLVDGRSPLLLDQAELLLESGRHEIEARAPGYQIARSTLNVDGGDRTTLVMALAPDTVATTSSPRTDTMSAPLPASARTAPPDGSHARGRAALSTVGYISLGVGIAGLVGFGVVTGFAIAEKNRLEERCPNAVCNLAYQNDVRRYDALRTASTITLIAGGALTLLGTTLLLVRPTENEHAARATIEPVLGPGAVGIRGRL